MPCSIRNYCNVGLIVSKPLCSPSGIGRAKFWQTLTRGLCPPGFTVKV